MRELLLEVVPRDSELLAGRSLSTIAEHPQAKCRFGFEVLCPRDRFHVVRLTARRLGERGVYVVTMGLVLKQGTTLTISQAFAATIKHGAPAS